MCRIVNVSEAIINVTSLGQVGYKLEYSDVTIYIDPYLSNSVQEKEDIDCKRLLPIPIHPEQIEDADFILITHDHRDHCDEDTLIPISRSSPQSIFICPEKIRTKLTGMGISSERINVIGEEVIRMQQNINLYAVPAAHPKVEKNINGGWSCIGYVIEFEHKRLYHAGDTSVAAEIVDVLSILGNIDVAFLPVNERNYYRDKKGILGNMSIREAFKFAEEIQAGTVVPTHWDMFADNQVYREEIELLYNKLKPNFKLLIEPSTI